MMRSDLAAVLYGLGLSLGMAAQAHAGSSTAQIKIQTPEAHSVERLTLCHRGSDEATTSPSLRPTRTAICPYDVKDMYRRLAEIISRQNVQISVTDATGRFGLPGMRTDFDDNRQASYSMLVSGKGGWKMRLWVRESAFPLNDTRQPAFTPGERPKRLFNVDQLDMRYDIRITLPEDMDAPGQCLTVANAAEMARATGWEDHSLQAMMSVTDGGPGEPTYVRAGVTIVMGLKQQAGRLATKAEMAASCVTDMIVMQPPVGES
jgi:hypothetical protein